MERDKDFEAWLDNKRAQGSVDVLNDTPAFITLLVVCPDGRSFIVSALRGSSAATIVESGTGNPWWEAVRGW